MNHTGRFTHNGVPHLDTLRSTAIKSVPAGENDTLFLDRVFESILVLSPSVEGGSLRREYPGFFSSVFFPVVTRSVANATMCKIRPSIGLYLEGRLTINT